MRILVNGKEVCLDKNISFEYISENPLFTEAEGYTMDITFPMKDCPENILVFGALHVPGVDIRSKMFNAEILSGQFRKTGILTVISASEKEIKAQFLEGRSAQNFNTDASLQTKLTDMDFSDYDGTGGALSQQRFEGDGWTDFAVFDTTTETVIWPDYGAPGSGSYRSRHIMLSHLIDITARMAGYSVEMSALEAIPMFSHIAVANAAVPVLDRSGDGIVPLNKSLPDWTVLAFMRHVGNYFGCVTSIDSVAKRITFTPYSTLARHGQTIPLEENDDFSTEIFDVEPEYKGNRTFTLPKESNPDNLNICPWLLSLPWMGTEVLRSADFFDKIDRLSRGVGVDTIGQWTDKLFHIMDPTPYGEIDQYALITKRYDDYNPDPETGEPVTPEEGDTPDRIYLRAEIINQYAGFSTEGEELGIAPCPTDWKVVRGSTYKLPLVAVPFDKHTAFLNNGNVPVETAFEAMAGGEPETVKHFDRLWIVLVEQHLEHVWTPSAGYLYPYPVSDGRLVYTRKYEPFVEMESSQDGMQPVTRDLYVMPYTLSPAAPEIQAYRNLPEVDESVQYRFRFLSDTLPDPKCVFLIHGRRYACKRLTAHFTVNGMSELVEGEFYKIIS